MNAIEGIIEEMEVFKYLGGPTHIVSDATLNGWLAALRKLHEGAVEGWIGPGKTGTEFAENDGTFIPGDQSKRVLLLPESDAP